MEGNICFIFKITHNFSFYLIHQELQYFTVQRGYKSLNIYKV